MTHGSEDDTIIYGTAEVESALPELGKSGDELEMEFRADLVNAIAQLSPQDKRILAPIVYGYARREAATLLRMSLGAYQRAYRHVVALLVKGMNGHA